MLRHRINPGLELRLLQPEHAAEHFAVVDANRATLREWLPWVDALERVADSEKFIATALREQGATRAYTSGIWSMGRLVGVIGHNRIDVAARIAFPGWWLVPAAQGQGIMTRCCQVVIEHAFKQLLVNRIVTGVATGNVRGHVIVKRLGFKQISTLKNAEVLKGRSVDHFIYSLVPGQTATGAASAT